MRFVQAIVLAHRLLSSVGADDDSHSSEALSFQSESMQIPALSFQDWSSVIVQPAGPVSLKSTPVTTKHEPTVTEHITQLSIDHAFAASSDGPQSFSNMLQGFVKSLLDFAIAPASIFPHPPWSHHHPSSPIDLGQYTIWEVYVDIHSKHEPRATH